MRLENTTDDINLHTNNSSWGRGDKEDLNLASSAIRHLFSFSFGGEFI